MDVKSAGRILNIPTVPWFYLWHQNKVCRRQSAMIFSNWWCWHFSITGILISPVKNMENSGLISAGSSGIKRQIIFAANKQKLFHLFLKTPPFCRISMRYTSPNTTNIYWMRQLTNWNKELLRSILKLFSCVYCKSIPIKKPPKCLEKKAIPSPSAKGDAKRYYRK